MKDYIHSQQSVEMPNGWDDACMSTESAEDWPDTSSSSTHSESINSLFDLSFCSTWGSADERSEDLGSESAIPSMNLLVSDDARRFDYAPTSLRDFCFRLVRRALTDPGLLEPFPEIYALVRSTATSQQLTVNEVAASLYIHLCDMVSPRCATGEEQTWEDCTLVPTDNSLHIDQSSSANLEVPDLCSHPMRILYGNVWDEFKNDAYTLLNSHALLTGALDESLRQKTCQEEENQEQEEQEQEDHETKSKHDHELVPCADVDMSALSPMEVPEEVICVTDTLVLFLKRIPDLLIFLILSFLIVLFLLRSPSHLASTLAPFRPPIFIVTDFWDDLYLWLKFGIHPSGSTGRLLVGLRPFGLLDRFIALLCVP